MKLQKNTLYKFALYCFLLISINSFGQSSLNDYEMALIPARFKFQKEDNQYRINATVKAFLKQKGFQAFLSTDVLPEGFLDYNCNKVMVDVVEENTLFSTKLKVVFTDCKQNVLFTTDLGESREKEYAKANNEALLQALKSFNKANYVFSGKTYYDEEASEKIKAREVENISVETVKTIKTESKIKVTNLFTQQEMTLYRTSNPIVFLCYYKNVNGVVVSKDGNWHFEYILNDELKSEKLDIKI